METGPWEIQMAEFCLGTMLNKTAGLWNSNELSFEKLHRRLGNCSF